MTGSMMIMIILMTRQTRRPWIWVMNCTPSRNIYKGHNLKNCRTGMNSKRACSHDQIDQVSMGECHDCYFVISEYSHIWLFLGWAICQLWSHLWASQISRVWCENHGFTWCTLGVCHGGHIFITRQTKSGICVMHIMSVIVGSESKVPWSHFPELVLLLILLLWNARHLFSLVYPCKSLGKTRETAVSMATTHIWSFYSNRCSSLNFNDRNFKFSPLERPLEVLSQNLKIMLINSFAYSLIFIFMHFFNKNKTLYEFQNLSMWQITLYHR